jgi:betaine lipid synthase
MARSILDAVSPNPHVQILLVGLLLTLLISAVFLFTLFSDHLKAGSSKRFGPLMAFFWFFYASFLKPLSGFGSQEDALESFYKAQASAYDTTRSKLLKGREDMLCLAAAQLKHRELKDGVKKRRIWVDVSPDAAISVPSSGNVAY